MLWAIALASMLVGCPGLRPVVRKSGTNAESETRAWHNQILRLGQNGDWLVIRGYNSSDHLVALAANAELSHAGVLDIDHASVIEAVAPVVRCVTLESFLSGADRVVLIRPPESTPASGRDAVRRARSRLGSAYDFLGTVGLPDPDRFYCSELAVWSTGRDVDVDGPEHIVKPVEMLEMGTILFDTKNRAD